MKQICYVVSASYTAQYFLLPHIIEAAGEYQVTLIANSDDFSFLPHELSGKIACHTVEIVRRPNLLKDIRALITLIRFFRRSKFEIVHSVSPKAGLLAMSASKVARIPIRIHTFTGQVWATKGGLSRYILKFADKCISHFATDILTDSESQLTFLRREGVLSKHQGMVLGKGSIVGVNVNRFRPNPSLRREERSRLGFSENHLVFLYLGRLNRDKGVIDLVNAFCIVKSIVKSAKLVVAGPDEGKLYSEIVNILSEHIDDVRIEGHVEFPESLYACADVFCMPSYREGFGSAALEAGSVGLPTVGSRVTGLTDCIEDGVTGLFHQPGCVTEIAEKMVKVARDEQLRQHLGAAARDRAHRFFDQRHVVKQLLKLYRTLLE